MDYKRKSSLFNKPEYEPLGENERPGFLIMRHPPSSMVEDVIIQPKEEVLARWRSDRRKCAAYICAGAATSWLLISMLIEKDFVGGAILWVCWLLPLIILSVIVNYRDGDYIAFVHNRREVFFIAPWALAAAYSIHYGFGFIPELITEGRWFSAVMNGVALFILPIFYVQMAEMVGLFSRGLFIATRLMLLPGLPFYGVPVLDTNKEFTDWVKKNHPSWIGVGKESMIDLHGIRNTEDKIFIRTSGAVEDVDVKRMTRREFEDATLRSWQNEALLSQRTKAHQEAAIEREKLEDLMRRSADASPTKKQNKFW